MAAAAAAGGADGGGKALAKDCKLGSKTPEGSDGAAESKTYTCAGCGASVLGGSLACTRLICSAASVSFACVSADIVCAPGYKAWRAHLAKQKKAKKRQRLDSGEKEKAASLATKKKAEQRKRKKARVGK